MNDSPLLKSIQSRYGIEAPTHSAPLTGGEWKTLWRLDGAQCAYVVSISHPTAIEAGIIYEHRLLRYLHPQLPPIPAPLLARDGSTYFIDQGRIISLFPLMPGEMADGDQVHLIAADFLARFHQVGVSYPDRSPRPGVLAWHEWDWCAAEWPLIEAALTSTPQTSNLAAQRLWQGTGVWASQIIAHRQQIADARTYFQQWLADLAHADRHLTSGPLHDDYHGNNLLLATGQVTALLDWDGCHPDWLAFDVANGIWEFCPDDEAHTLDISAAQSFLQAYATASGPVREEEYELLIPLIRCRRLIEIMSALRGLVTGGDWDESPDYLLHNLLSLENLRGIRL